MKVIILKTKNKKIKKEIWEIEEVGEKEKLKEEKDKDLCRLLLLLLLILILQFQTLINHRNRRNFLFKIRILTPKKDIHQNLILHRQYNQIRKNHLLLIVLHHITHAAVVVALVEVVIVEVVVKEAVVEVIAQEVEVVIPVVRVIVGKGKKIKDNKNNICSSKALNIRMIAKLV